MAYEAPSAAPVPPVHGEGHDLYGNETYTSDLLASLGDNGRRRRESQYVDSHDRLRDDDILYTIDEALAKSKVKSQSKTGDKLRDKAGERSREKFGDRAGQSGSTQTSATGPMLESHVFRPVDPKSGQKLNWKLVSFEKVHIDAKDLKSLVLERRNRKKMTANDAFIALTSDQQSIVNRFIISRNASEKDRNFEWKIVDAIQHKKKSSRSGTHVDRIQLVIKRVAKEKHEDRTSAKHHPGNVIDLSRPVETEKSKDQKSNKFSYDKEKTRSKSSRTLDLNDLDDILGSGNNNTEDDAFYRDHLGRRSTRDSDRHRRHTLSGQWEGYPYTDQLRSDHMDREHYATQQYPQYEHHREQYASQDHRQQSQHDQYREMQQQYFPEAQQQHYQEPQQQHFQDPRQQQYYKDAQAQQQQQQQQQQQYQQHQQQQPQEHYQQQPQTQHQQYQAQTHPDQAQVQPNQHFEYADIGLQQQGVAYQATEQHQDVYQQQQQHQNFAEQHPNSTGERYQTTTGYEHANQGLSGQNFHATDAAGRHPDAHYMQQYMQGLNTGANNPLGQFTNTSALGGLEAAFLGDTERTGDPQGILRSSRHHSRSRSRRRSDQDITDLKAEMRMLRLEQGKMEDRLRRGPSRARSSDSGRDDEYDSSTRSAVNRAYTPLSSVDSTYSYERPHAISHRRKSSTRSAPRDGIEYHLRGRRPRHDSVLDDLVRTTTSRTQDRERRAASRQSRRSSMLRYNGDDDVHNDYPVEHDFLAKHHHHRDNLDDLIQTAGRRPTYTRGYTLDERSRTPGRGILDEDSMLDRRDQRRPTSRRRYTADYGNGAWGRYHL